MLNLSLVGGSFPNMMGNISPNSQVNFNPHQFMCPQGMGSRHGSVLLVSNLSEEVRNVVFVCLWFPTQSTIY